MVEVEAYEYEENESDDEADVSISERSDRVRRILLFELGKNGERKSHFISHGTATVCFKY